jgi:hypothetical protein
MGSPIVTRSPQARRSPSTGPVSRARPTSADSAQETQPPQLPNRGTGNLFLRVVLATATTLVSLNLWTGGPLFAVWVGSRIQAAVGTLSMAAVGATVGVLIVVTFLLYRVLAWLSVRYNAVIGREMKRQQAAWLKPMSGERRTIRTREPLTAVERIVVTTVVVAFEVFVVWFFFFAHYSLPG